MGATFDEPGYPAIPSTNQGRTSITRMCPSTLWKLILMTKANKLMKSGKRKRKPWILPRHLDLQKQLYSNTRPAQSSLDMWILDQALPSYHPSSEAHGFRSFKAKTKKKEEESAESDSDDGKRPQEVHGPKQELACHMQEFLLPLNYKLRYMICFLFGRSS